MKKILFWWLICMIPIHLFGQEIKDKSKAFDLGTHMPITIAYYGNFGTHPGVKLGVDYNLLFIEKIKSNKKFTKTKRKVLVLTPSVGYYAHPGSHQAILANVDLAWRMYSNSLFYFEPSIGICYNTRINDGETYQKMSDGSVSNIGKTSRSYFAPSVGFAVGKQFMVQDTKPLAIYIKSSAMMLMGYDGTQSLELAAEAGARFTPNWGIKRGKVKTIVKNNSKR
jgi:hypothetical protein